MVTYDKIGNMLSVNDRVFYRDEDPWTVVELKKYSVKIARGKTKQWVDSDMVTKK